MLLPALFYVLIILSVCKAQEAGSTGCTPENCQLPDCLCASRRPPLDAPISEIPMLIAFTFDDAVNEQVYSPLLSLFNASRKNPNGAPISMTLFVSHMFTNHCQVAEFYLGGHEIASHSITHRLPITYWKNAPYEDYDIEIDGQRGLLSSRAGFKKEEIKGYRSPFIQPGGNTQFQVLQDRNFTYDSSLFIAAPVTEDRYWPYTLDFPRQTPCQIFPCPNKGFPGIWELPIQPIPDHTGTPCTFLDTCMETMSKEDIYGYLFDSFNSSYHRNRAPLIINMHAYWYNNNPNGMAAFDDFIVDLVRMNDVYLITATQLVDWMKTPTKLSDLNSFESFRYAERTTRPCKEETIRKGVNRPIKEGFEPYTSQIKGSLYKVAFEDGGRSVLLVTFFFFVALFVYIQVTDV